MLKKLTIRNVALADHVDLEFDSGLTVLTGETGAGKSVLVNSLALALGARADRDSVRHGESEASVYAAFDGSNQTLELQRTVGTSSGSRIVVNGEKATASSLRAVTSPLAEIMGQHANQQLLDESNHLLFVDRFGKLDSQREKVEGLFESWQTVQAEWLRLQRRREQLLAEQELLRFQHDEIEKAQVRIGEENELERERKLLDSARELMAASSAIVAALDGEDQSILSAIANIQKELDAMVGRDDTIQAHSDDLSDITYRLQDLRQAIESYGGSVKDDPARLEEINLRLDELYRLKKKYGGSEETVLQTLKDVEILLDNRPDVDAAIDQLGRQTDTARQAYAKAALALSKKRTTVARKIKKLVEQELRELAIDKAEFTAAMIREEDDDGIECNGDLVKALPVGLETARFLFSANPGEPAKPMVKVASGGEISRVLLAIKSAEFQKAGGGRPLLVFDEVDAGIGGQTAIDLANKLKQLSEKSQVLVVTHLHQIARLADHHFAISKATDSDGRNTIQVKRLTKGERKAEIDRMIALPDQ